MVASSHRRARCERAARTTKDRAAENVRQGSFPCPHHRRFWGRILADPCRWWDTAASRPSLSIGSISSENRLTGTGFNQSRAEPGVAEPHRAVRSGRSSQPRAAGLHRPSHYSASRPSVASFSRPVPWKTVLQPLQDNRACSSRAVERGRCSAHTASARFRADAQ